MRNIFRIFTIIILLILIYYIYVSVPNSTYAQEVQKPTNSEPNEMSSPLRALQERIERLEAEERMKYLKEHPEEVNKPKPVHPNDTEIEKIIARQIEADNNRYKDRIFGNSFCGLAMSIEPKKDVYEIGEDIEISIIVRNFSKEKQLLRWDRYYGDMEDYSYAMYFPDGNSVPNSELIEEYEANINKPHEFPRIGSGGLLDFKPEQIYSFNNKINRYFKIEKEGTYFLVIMRNITGEWKDGFMISNMTKINIVKKKEEQ